MDAQVQADMDRIPEEKTYIPGIDPSIIAEAKKDQDAKEKRDQEEAVRIIQNFDDDFSLSAWGYSEKLKVTRGNAVEYVQLKIKAVGVQDVIDRTEKRAPRPPSSFKTYKKGSAEAIALGSNVAVLVREVDYSDPGYMEAQDEHNRRSGQMILLSALAYDWKDASGNVILKGADVNEPTQIVNEEACLNRLRRMRLTSSHYTILLANIRALTEDVEVQEARE